MFLLVVFILMNIGFLLVNPALTILPNHDVNNNNSITSLPFKEEAQILDLHIFKVISVKIIFIPKTVSRSCSPLVLPVLDFSHLKHN